MNDVSVEDVRSQTYLRNLIAATPLVVLVLIGFALLLNTWNLSLIWSPVGLGALGWLIALILRGPVMVIGQKLTASKDSVRRIVVLSSGVLEEGVRLVVLLLVGRTFAIAYSIGWGWAAIEVGYTLLTGFLIASLLRRTDEKALQARSQLQEAGMVSEAGPLLGVVERVAATALHIGFTLLLASSPLWLVLTVPLHSGLNLTVSQMVKTNPVRAELIIAGVGVLIFLVGLAAARPA
ncbi:MAG: YhfC family intramembrane metalloprotease [Anaerolineae bacterium]|nr:YhfC family intramembrane metalloprotease [Anaerolineae bacterium]